ncbi:MAG: hypothetical protein ACJ77N_09440 [Chloroflexota bacterium]
MAHAQVPPGCTENTTGATIFGVADAYSCTTQESFRTYGDRYAVSDKELCGSGLANYGTPGTQSGPVTRYYDAQGTVVLERSDPSHGMPRIALQRQRASA